MKKLFLTALLLTSFSVLAEDNYPDPDRFVQYNVPGTYAYVLKDTKTGCEYLTNGDRSGYTLIQHTCNVPVGGSK